MIHAIIHAALDEALQEIPPQIQNRWSREKEKLRVMLVMLLLDNKETEQLEALVGLKLGIILRKLDKITSKQLQAAVARQRNSGMKIGEILIDLDFVAECEVEKALKIQKGELGDIH